MNRRHRIVLDTFVWSVASVFLVLQLLGAAEAATGAPANVYAEECGGCHVPYPTRLLTTGEWSAVLGRLDRHYGVDASLDGPALAAVAAHLHGAVSAGGTAPLPRITTGRWFRNEHRELDPAGWTSPAVKSPSNCGACHSGAAQGSFAERELRLPAGVRQNENHEREDEHEHDD